MIDDRAESYKKRAAEQAASADSSIGKYEVNIKPSHIVTGIGGVAIRNPGAGSVEFTSSSTNPPIESEPVPASEALTTPPSSNVNPEVKEIFTGEKVVNVPVSSGVAQKLAQQSLRDDVSYSVNVVRPEKTQSIQQEEFIKEQDLSQGYVTATEENNSIRDSIKDYARRQEYKAIKSDTPIFYELGAAAASVASTVIYPFVDPIGFGKDTFNFGKSLITDPQGTAYSFGQKALSEPGITAGEIGGNIIIGKIPGAAKNVYVRVGSKYVSPETVFDAGVLKGETTFPETTSVRQSLKEFNNPIDGEITVQTSSPAKLSGDTAGFGKKASIGLEDPGIYVTPAGRGSPAFLGVTRTGYDITLNPLKGLGVPTVTRFGVKGVVQYPRDVITQPGFEAVTDFQKSVLAGEEVAVITKRSEIGQGNIQAQEFTMSPYKKPLDVVDKLFGNSETKTFIEPGTSEIEAVIPVGSKFEYVPRTVFGKIKGFDEYTIVEGTPVAIRDARIIGKADSPILMSGRIIDEGEILRGSVSLGSVGTKVVNPSSAFISSGGVSLPVRSSIVNKGSSNISSSGVSSSISGLSYGRPSSSRSKVVSSNSIVSSSKLSSEFVGSNYGRSSKSESSSVLSSSGSSIASSSVSKGYSIPRASSSVIGSSYGKSAGYYNVPPSEVSPLPMKRSDDRGVFSVDVRRFGKFQTVGRGLSLPDAIKLGKREVGNTAAATFRVRKGGEVVKVDPIRGYYMKEKNVIENPSRRIKSYGELKEITFEGIKASKNRNRRGLL